MTMKNKLIGYAVTGSYCTFEKSFRILNEIVSKDNNVIPIVSTNVATTDTRFGKASKHLAMLREITGNEVVSTIEEAEIFGPKVNLDLLIVAPCTSNTLAKFANAVTDTPVTMAMKAHVRSQSSPLVLALSSNDALGNSLRNIGYLYNTKNIYFCPMVEDDIQNKPNSLVAIYERLIETCEHALDGKQVRGIFSY
jgi:dipicolinate synthase subunit B